MRKFYFIKNFFAEYISSHKGFTLIELLAAIAVFVIIFGILISFIIWTYNSAINIQATSEVENSFQQAMETMLREIKRSRSIYTPVSNDSQLSLETINYTPDGEISSYIDFFVCGEQICFKKEGQLPVALTSQKTKVDSLSFVYLTQAGEPPSIQINMGISHQNLNSIPHLNVSMDGASTASLRVY